MLIFNRQFKSTFILFIAAELIGCASISHDDNPQKFYDAAITDAAIATPEKIMPLLPIPAGSSVTVISWVTENRLPCRATEPQCVFITGNDRIWVTLAGEVQGLCRSWNLSGDPLRRRLEQLLGLPMDPPPQYRKAKFVIMTVPQGRLERACLGVNDSDAAHPQCTFDVQASTPTELRNYVLQQMAGSYILRNPKGPGYPFTRLGYTYDWSPIAKAPNHYGASEFLLMPVTTAKVAAQIATDDYCK
jgi:hypothetical protein